MQTDELDQHFDEFSDVMNDSTHTRAHCARLRTITP